MSDKFSRDSVLEIGRDVLKSASEAIAHTHKNLDGSFVEAVELIVNSNGKIIFSGIGKSGIIAQKLSSTMSSTGTFSHFIHPSEALHGDLGMVEKNDILILLSNSGKTPEMITFLEHVQELDLNNKIVAITCRKNCAISKYADVLLTTNSTRETSKKNSQLYYIPTTSTTASLALGDALISACQTAKGFEMESFLKYHPGGNIGKLLKRRIK